MQVATLPGYEDLVGAEGHERQALRRRRGERVGCLQCCEEREDSSRRHRFVCYECSPDARGSDEATAMATAHRSPENMSVGKRTRGVSTLGLRVDCVVRAQRAGALLACWAP